MRLSDGRLRGFRPPRSLIDPCPQQTDLPGAQPLPGGRHDKTFLVLRSRHAGHEQDELAGGAVTGLDDGSRIAPLQGPLRAVEAETVHLLRRTVTGNAIRLEDGGDVPREIDLHGSRRGQPRRPVRSGFLRPGDLGVQQYARGEKEKGTRQKAVFRVSCLVIREKPYRPCCARQAVRAFFLRPACA